jgi:hypothetical protein
MFVSLPPRCAPMCPRCAPPNYSGGHKAPSASRRASACPINTCADDSDAPHAAENAKAGRISGIVLV